MKEIKNNLSNKNFIVTVVLLVLFSLLVIFHLLILVRIIPFDAIWGGKLKDVSQMRLFESVSVIISLMMMAVIAINAGIIKFKIHPVVIKAALWAMVILFALNTIGNFTSENQFEKNVFTPTTLLLSVLCFLLIITKKNQK